MDAPLPELTIEWYHEGFHVIRVFVQDPLDMDTRERLMTRVMTFRDVPDLASLRREVDAIAATTGLRSTFTVQADHTNPFGDWVTLGFRRA
jgi:hypothetical protein